MEQSFIHGFIKRAAENGISEQAAIELLKKAADVPYPNALAAQGPGAQVQQGLSNLNAALGGYPGKAWNAAKGLVSNIHMPTFKPEYPMTPASEEFQRTGAPVAEKAFNQATQKNYNAPAGSVPTISNNQIAKRDG